MPLLKKSPIGRYRWVICALLFFATTINYVDRMVLTVLEPELEKVFKWTDSQYGYVSASFNLAYAIGYLFMGWLMDRLGTRIGYALSLTVWSLAAAAHALTGSIVGFGIARFALGLGESGNFPAAVKTVGEWFPKKERALATGLFNAGSNVGAIIAPAVVPIIFVYWGWRAAFITTGLFGIIWVFFWLPMYRKPREHPRLSAAELAHIESDPPDPVSKVPWASLLPFRQTWAFTIGKTLTDAVWWFYLAWLGKFLAEQFGITLKEIGLPMITAFVLADIGSIMGGWQSSRLISRGWSVNAGRKTAMLTCALFVLPVIGAPLTESMWLAIVLIGVAMAAHQGFSANLFTLTTDMFPRSAVGSIMGIGGFAGAMGGVLLNIFAGHLKEMTGNYVVIFACASGAYLVALLVIHVLAPRLEPIAIGGAASTPGGS